MKRCRVGALIGLLLGLTQVGPPEAYAHNLGQSYLYLQIYEDNLTGRFEIALSDLNPALGLAGTDDEINAENLDERVAFLESYYLDRVAFKSEGKPLPIRLRGHQFLDARGGFVLLPFEFESLDRVPESLTIDYSVLFDEEPSHRGFLLVEHNWATGTFANENQVSLVFSPDSRVQDFEPASSGRLQGFLALARLGFRHMLEGLDHLFFVLALLLVTVMRAEGRRWRALRRLGPAMRNVGKLLTAVLAACATAILLAALGIGRLPAPVVETVIAVSILVAAAGILYPPLRVRAWWVVFGLGLFHGLGFADALYDLRVLSDHFGLSISAFALGIGGALLVVIGVVFPLLFLVHRLDVYRKPLLPVAAVAMALISGIWSIERAFGVDVPLRELLPVAVQRVIP